MRNITAADEVVSAAITLAKACKQPAARNVRAELGRMTTTNMALERWCQSLDPNSVSLLLGSVPGSGVNRAEG
jgi:hypothetical protein